MRVEGDTKVKNGREQKNKKVEVKEGDREEIRSKMGRARNCNHKSQKREKRKENVE